MNWYTVNYLRESELANEHLENARWRLETDGDSLEPLSLLQNRKRRSQYLNFIYQDTAGLSAIQFRFFFSGSYKFPHLVLSDDEIDGTIRAIGSNHPWDRRETQCVSEETVGIIKFFLGRDVSKFFAYDKASNRGIG